MEEATGPGSLHRHDVNSQICPWGWFLVLIFLALLPRHPKPITTLRPTNSCRDLIKTSPPVFCSESLLLKECGRGVSSESVPRFLNQPPSWSHSTSTEQGGHVKTNGQEISGPLLVLSGRGFTSSPFSEDVGYRLLCSKQTIPCGPTVNILSCQGHGLWNLADLGSIQ